MGGGARLPALPAARPRRGPGRDGVALGGVRRSPVLSKQRVDTRPAAGMRKGSVQYTPARCSESSDAFTASESCIGSSGGTTDVSTCPT